MLLDYDGTLAPVVPDPSKALPAPGALEVLGRLAGRYALVAVISGRPVAFLRQALGPPAGVSLFGLYGLEELDPCGEVITSAEVAPWRPVVDEVADRAEGEAPPGARVERKGLSVALHWREHPASEAWARRFAAAASSTGLVAQEARRAIELRPPVAVDKGTVVARCARGCRAVAYVGDDLGDLAAFEALGDLARQGVTVARVAAADPEGPVELAAAADVVVRGVPGVVALLEALAG